MHSSKNISKQETAGLGEYFLHPSARILASNRCPLKGMVGDGLMKNYGHMYGEG